MHKIPVRLEDTSLEILARIAKAEASKYNCSLDIDFSGNTRKICFVGNKACTPDIVENIRNIFRK